MREHLCLSVPATSANLGVGYDSLALALDVWYRFSFERAEELSIRGCDENLCNENNLMWTSYVRACQELGRKVVPLAISIESEAPAAGGLGSSAASIVAGIAAASSMYEETFDLATLAGLAAELEGHADNVAAAVYGGLCTCFKEDPNASWQDALHVGQLDIHDAWRFVVAAPPAQINTHKARELVPETLSLNTHVWQTGHLAALVGAFASADAELMSLACADLVHEPYRARAIAHFADIKATALEAGAAGFVISGSGASMLAICPNAAAQHAVFEALSHGWDELWLKQLSASKEGLTIEEAL